MTKKLLPIWIAISSVIILAGIVLYALLGFNLAGERRDYQTIEVKYDVVLEISKDGERELDDIVRRTIKAQGIKVVDFETVKEVDSNSGSETGNTVLVYTLGSVTDEALTAAKTAVASAINSNLLSGILPSGSEIFVSAHASEGVAFYEAIWRGALGLAVGAIVVLVYIGVRFGVASALTGLTTCAHDVLLTLAFFAVTRIPVYAFAPLLFAAIAAVTSLLLWLVQCIKMRENFKTKPYEGLSAEDAVFQSVKTSQKYVLGIAIALAAVLVISGGVATAGVRLFLLPALVPVAVATYSSMLFGPALHVHVKAAFDKLKAKRKVRYVGKAKAEKAKED